MSGDPMAGVRLDASAALEPSPAAKAINVTAKSLLVALLLLVLVDPASSHLEGKAPVARAVGYTVAAFALTALWYGLWRDRVAFPWLADVLITLTCFSDVLGNRLDLYDSISWFDDWMHFVNTGLLAAAVVLLTLTRRAGFGAVLERSLAFGATAAIAWELAEYAAFISGGTEKRFAYEDTLGDLGLGVLGAACAAWIVHRAWRSGGLLTVTPMPGVGGRA